MRSVSFLHSGGPSMASYRYRALTPALELKAMVNVPSAEILIFSKPCAEDVETATKAKKDGKKVVVDLCDDHFKRFPHYTELATIADFCVAPTEEMRKRIPAKNVAVIPDPYEVEELEPHANGDQILWFGHNAGLKALQGYSQTPNLTIVTGPDTFGGMIRWTPENLKEEMRKANIAIFPTVKGHEYKSPNRLVNALRAGLFPVCDAHPSYQEFRKFIWMSDVRTGLRWAKEFSHELNDLVRVGQSYIRDRFSPKTIGLKWQELLEAL